MDHPQKPAGSLPFRMLLLAALLAVGVLVLAACQPVQAPSSAGQATEMPAAEQTAAPVEEATVPMVGDPERGGYIFAMTTGCGCHFNRDLGAPAGGNKFEGPFGIVYAANITSDPETGLGGWSETDIVHALRLGVRPDGSQLHPIMPYMDWSALSDQDAYDLAAAILAIPPVSNQIPPSELATEPAAFAPAQTPPAAAPTDPVERGAYLVAIARCGRCHTPKTETGAPDTTRLLSGAPVQDTIAPNLTPDESSAISFLSDEAIANFLLTGDYEDGSRVQGPMEGVINNGTSKFTDEDRLAIAAYLKSLPPIVSE